MAGEELRGWVVGVGHCVVGGSGGGRWVLVVAVVVVVVEVGW